MYYFEFAFFIILQATRHAAATAIKITPLTAPTPLMMNIGQKETNSISTIDIVLVSAEQIASVNLVLHVIQAAIITIYNDSLAAFLELVKVIYNSVTKTPLLFSGSSSSMIYFS